VRVRVRGVCLCMYISKHILVAHTPWTSVLCVVESMFTLWYHEGEVETKCC